ncbi:MAG: hypothetical protein GXO10_02045 [Crenarchaeota archaeon]|nr:hypothetical protein [Thermoproteota archaeon]
MITLIREVLKVLDELSRSVETEYEKKILLIIKNILESYEKCYNCNNKISITILSFLLKLCLEIAFQLKYFKDKFSNRPVEDFIRELYKRSKKGSSFSIRMLTDSKNIPGKFKKDFLKTYLKICEYVHPSYNLIFSNIDRSIIDNIFQRFVDILLYILLLCYGPRDDICRICLSNDLYYCSRRCK